jgi:multidrug resistance efflux pump
MKKAVPLIVLLAVAGVVYAVYYIYYRQPPVLVLTGLVTTNDVVVSPLIAGRIRELPVAEGDTVRKDQVVAVIVPDEFMADSAYSAHSAAAAGSQVQENEAALRFQQMQLADQVRQAESTLASIQSQIDGATSDLTNAQLTFTRSQNLMRSGAVAQQDLDQARTAFAGAQAKLDGFKKQAEAQRATVALARSNAEQVAVRRSQVATSQQQQQAADAQRAKADVRLSYTVLKAPLDGIVDVLAARVGEVVNPSQPIVTLINPDALWVRADVEETYIERLKLGGTMTVRLPSGEERQGTIFYRGVDAGYATQRDVSRTKRDIKTFEVRLRVDNRDRILAVGMTASVLLDLTKP